MIKKMITMYEQDLAERNQRFEHDDESAYDDLHEKFTVNVNNCKISLGSMDVYDAFYSFLKVAADDEADSYFVDDERKQLEQNVEYMHEICPQGSDTDDVFEQKVDKLLDMSVSFSIDNRTFSTTMSIELAQELSKLAEKCLQNYDKYESVDAVNTFLDCGKKIDNSAE
jgi:hypothetical protein